MGLPLMSLLMAVGISQAAASDDEEAQENPENPMDGRTTGLRTFSSIKKVANHVWGALQKSGIIDKGKDKLMKAGRELGGKAIDAAAKKADEVAKSKGFDESDITSKLAGPPMTV